MSKNVLSGTYIFSACVVRNENVVVVDAETSYSVLYFHYIILYYILYYIILYYIILYYIILYYIILYYIWVT